MRKTGGTRLWLEIGLGFNSIMAVRGVTKVTKQRPLSTSICTISSCWSPVDQYSSPFASNTIDGRERSSQVWSLLSHHRFRLSLALTYPYSALSRQQWYSIDNRYLALLEIRNSKGLTSIHNTKVQWPASRPKSESLVSDECS